MEFGFFHLFAIGFTVAWVVITFVLDSKAGTSVLSYALFVIGCLAYYYNYIFFGSLCVVLGICVLILFFLIYKNEHNWHRKEDDDNRQKEPLTQSEE